MSSQCAALPYFPSPSNQRQLLPIDLKNLRLVNPPWASVAAFILFHSFVSDLAETDKKKLDAIFTSRPGGILDSIKTLTVPYKGPDAHEKSSQDLLRLATVLPRDTLTQLQSCVERDALAVILGSQRKIQKLNIFVVSNGQPSSPPNVNSVRGNLNELQILNLMVKDNNSDNCACWTPHMPSLRGLCLTARSATASFGGWHLSQQDAKFKLRCLIFDRISLPDSPKKIVGMLGTSRLEVLSFERCRNSGPLIRV